MISDISDATIETSYMVFFSSFFAVLFGLPLGILLSITKVNSIFPKPMLNNILSTIVNIVRSFPFIILIILLFPLSRFIIGTSIGSTAAIIPLSIAAIPFVARLFESALEEVDNGLIEATLSMGASKFYVVKMMIMESMPALVNATTNTVVSLIGYSAMAGAVGAPGLGALAINIGYQNFDTLTLFLTCIMVIILVQLVQAIGDRLSRALRTHNFGIFDKFFR
ncbi:ABC transporter permease [Helicobacter muridarum]|uniref:ABC transporter permease n=1 Tax=Helicobacter muridarum TaxID=216 RepID=A0A4U8TIS6_9HELI|nr:methionine ABC transporter permease [Helicobacter muridarum]TLD99428.1 ABC transporter permease [Helicobacter muridarum]